MSATRTAPPAGSDAPLVRQLPRVDSEGSGVAGGDGQARAGWLFAAPFVVLYLLFLVGPVLVGLVVSFFNTTTVSPGLGEWVGVANYVDVLTTADFWSAMWHSVLFTLLSTPLLVLLPLVFAVLAARVSRGRWFFRLAFFAPYVVPSSIVVLVFGFMYTPETGLISSGFQALGLTPPDFLGSVTGGWFGVVLLTVWWTLGFNFILYTAAVQDIPEDLYEAAALDGASTWQQVRWVVLPQLKPTLALVLILQVLASLKVFDQIYLLLQGGPDGATRPAIQYIYDTGFTSYRGGYAAAATMVYFAVLVAVSATWALLRRRSAAREERVR